MKNLKIAIVGASGLVGEKILSLLSKEDFCQKPILLGTEKSAGAKYMFKGEILQVFPFSEKAISGCDAVFFATSESVSKKLVPKAIKSGCVVIDNSPAFRLKKDVPLIVPEINFSDYSGQKIIANPNCSTVQSVIALYPLAKKFGLKSVIAATYQSVSGCGKEGIAALKSARKSKFLPLEKEELSLSQKVFECDISNNCIPKIGELSASGYSREELKMQNETRKILNDKKLQISAFCVRVPAENCHGVFLRAKLKQDFSIQQAIFALREFEPITVIDEKCNPPYPINDSAKGSGKVFAGRIRKPCKKCIELYCVADNLLRGAAYNAVEICKKIANLH